MKKLLVVALMFVASVSCADSVFYNLGPLSLHIPLSNSRISYIYDAKGMQNLVGAETVVASAWKLEATAGAVTSLQGQGTPFVGVNMTVDNPLATHLSLAGVNLGLAGGYDFNTKAFILGPKASVNIF